MAPKNDRRWRITATQARKRPDIVSAARRGWLDMASGAGFPTWYETASPRDQANYERGRQWYLEAKAAGLPLSWPADTLLPRHVEAVGIAWTVYMQRQPPEEPAQGEGTY